MNVADSRDADLLTLEVELMGSIDLKLREEVEALHERCGVYTKPKIVNRILDAVEWRSDADLTASRLLEPAAGDGEFVIEAARRLVASFRCHGRELNIASLGDRINAFELHPGAAADAISRVTSVLQQVGVHHRTAAACAKTWIINADYLTAHLPQNRFTHVVGNPPYIRWSKIPQLLKAAYVDNVPSCMTGGDLFLPFIDRALDQLCLNGRCGFLCSDRWRYMAFAKGFRRKWLPNLEIASEESLPAIEAFATNVDAYPTILIATKKPTNPSTTTQRVKQNGNTLKELGYTIRVGPALGHTQAFVLKPHECGVEPELLHPWIDGSEITEGNVNWRGRRVIAIYRDDGSLINVKKYPLLNKRLKSFKDNLSRRSIVQNGAPWFRTIDRVHAPDWKRPKLVIPELAKFPRLAIDCSGSIPSHGVYAIFAPDDDIETLYERLRDGKLAQALEGIAPKVKGGYVRCYRRFLLKIRLEQ